MKNLWKMASESRKFVFQNTAPSSNHESIHDDTIERLEELKRSTRNADFRINNETAQQYASQVSTAADNAMQSINSLLTQAPSSLDIKTINAITAKTVGNFPYDKAFDKRSERNKLYRTEMVARLNDQLTIAVSSNSISVEDASTLMIRSMERLAYKAGTPTERKLYSAMNMITYGDSLSSSLANRFRGTAKRKALANEMDANTNILTFNNGVLTINGKTYTVEDFEVLAGGAMTNINPKLLSKFVLNHPIMNPEGTQILATLQNGCKGNVAIITVKEGRVGPVPPPTPVVPGNCDINCEVISAFTAANVDSELQNMTDPKIQQSVLDKLNINTPWLEMSHQDKVWAASQYQFEVNTNDLSEIEKFFAAIWEDKGFRHELQKVQDGRFMEGGIIGWIEQVPKIFQNKENAMNRRIQRKLGLSREDYDKMINQVNKDVANLVNSQDQLNSNLNNTLSTMPDYDRQQLAQTYVDNGGLPKWKKAIEQGSLYQAKKMLLSDLLVIAVSLGTDFTITNIKLPKWISHQLIQIPGMNAAAKTYLGENIEHNYTEFQEKVIKNLDKEIQLGDNAAMLTAELMQNIALLESLGGSDCEDKEILRKIYNKINKQNARLEMWANDMEKRIEDLLDAVEKRELTLNKEAKKAKRNSVKFLENTHGNRRAIRQARSVLKSALKSAKNGKKESLAGPNTISAIYKLQDALIKEFNDDFGSNLKSNEFGKGIENNERFTIDIKAHSIGIGIKRIKATIIEVENTNGQKILKAENITVGGKPLSSLRPGQQKRAMNKINDSLEEIMARKANIKQINWMGTVIDSYSKAIDTRRVRAAIYSAENNEGLIEGPQDKYSSPDLSTKGIKGLRSLENVRESSAFGLIMRMHRDPKTREILLDKNNNCENCWFSKEVKDQLISLFRLIDRGYSHQEQLTAFGKLWGTKKNPGQFRKEYSKFTQKIGKVIEKIDADGTITYEVNGQKYSCPGSQIKDVLKENESIIIYDEMVGEVAKRIPITLGMLTAFGQLTGLRKYEQHTIEHLNNIDMSGKDDALIDLVNSNDLSHKDILEMLNLDYGNSSWVNGGVIVDFNTNGTITVLTKEKFLELTGTVWSVNWTAQEGLNFLAENYPQYLLASKTAQHIQSNHSKGKNYSSRYSNNSGQSGNGNNSLYPIDYSSE